MELNDMKDMWEKMNSKLVQQQELNEKLIARMTRGQSVKNVSSINNVESVSFILTLLLLAVLLLQVPRVGGSALLIACYIFNIACGTIAVAIGYMNLKQLKAIDIATTPVTTLLLRLEHFKLFVAKQRTGAMILGPLMILSFYASVMWLINDVDIFDNITRYLSTILTCSVIYTVAVIVLYHTIYSKNIKEAQHNLKDIEEFKD